MISSDSEGKKTDKIQSAVEGANPRLAGFGVSRKVDEVTLSFAMWTDGAKVEFTLTGDKADLYRMAMGVNLEETQKLLSAKDARVNPAGAEKTKDAILLKYWTPPKASATQVVQAPAAPSPKAAEKPAPVPAPPAPKPEAKTEPKPEAKPVAQVPAPAPPPAPKVDEAASAAEREKRAKAIDAAYITALEARDADKLLAFAETYADSPKAATARELASRLKDDAAYRKALKEGSIDAFEAYIKAFPSSPRRAEVEDRIAQSKSALAARVEEERKAIASKVVAEDFAKAKKDGSLSALEKFAARYPGTPEAASAVDMVLKLRDDKAFAVDKGSAEGLARYLAAFPQGSHAAEAQRLLAAMDKKAEEGESPKAAGSLVAVAVKAAPVLDGVDADEAWAQAPVLTVPLVNGTGSVDVRAVHYQQKLYLLARWKDSSQSLRYRPWVWNATLKTYQQSDELDDAFAVAVHTSPTADACMKSGENDRMDVWLWRSFWSELSGHAADLQITIGKERLPRANPHLTLSGKGQVWIQYVNDKGEPAWAFDIPLPTPSPAPLLPSYKAQKGKGSASDVAARGQYKGGSWTVEFARAFDTGNEDDVSISRKGATLSFAVYDKSDKDGHNTTGPVRLEIQGK